jgi:hypothetical protein
MTIAANESDNALLAKLARRLENLRLHQKAENEGFENALWQQ